MNESLLEVHQLRKSFSPNGRGQAVDVLKSVSFSVSAGESLAIMGPSGSGKSTLLHLLGGLDVPNSGEVRFQGSNIYAWAADARARWRNRNVGFIFQFHHLLGELTALENAALPLRIAEVSRKEATLKATALLSEIGLVHRLHHRPSALSGGERQRVAIARALISDPDLILADEPTGSLDHEQGETILRYLLESQRKRPMTLVMVTHNREMAEKLHRIITICDGEIQHNTPAK